MTMSPDDVATAARRLAAKMLADQAVPMMISIVGLTGDPSEPVLTDASALVLVARGDGIGRVQKWVDEATGGPAMVEVEHPKRAGR